MQKVAGILLLHLRCSGVQLVQIYIRLRTASVIMLLALNIHEAFASATEMSRNTTRHVGAKT